MEALPGLLLECLGYEGQLTLANGTVFHLYALRGHCPENSPCHFGAHFVSTSASL